jgi:hypothetical protein
VATSEARFIARSGCVEADVEKSSYSEAAHYLSEELKEPIVQKDARLKLRFLTVKGIVDLNTNTIDAARDGSEALADDIHRYLHIRAGGCLALMSDWISNRYERQPGTPGTVLQLLPRSTAVTRCEGETENLRMPGQRGWIDEKGPVDVLRWREEKTQPDGTLKVVQHSKSLGHFRTKSEAKTAADAEMRKVNAVRQNPESTMQLADFVERH